MLEPKVSTRVPAALRTMRLLEQLGSAAGPVTAQSLANRLGIPRSSIYQLLEVLKAEGYVVHFPEEGRWSLGVAAFELGSAYLRHDPLERLAQPLLSRLLKEIDAIRPAGFAAVAQVGVLHGNELLYLLKSSTATESRDHLEVITDVGVRLPAHLTASGRCLLALLSENQFSASYRGSANAPLELLTENGPANMAELRKLLELDRARGYSVEIGCVSPNYASVAAAAVNHLGLPAAAFTVTFRSDSFEPSSVDSVHAQLGALVSRVARELSKRLGAR